MTPSGKTLLPQYLGMYRLTVESDEHYIVVMRNIFSNHLRIHKKYDLKGSTVDREASQKEREKDHPTFKDNDFLKDGVKIVIGEEAKQKLMATLTADVEFLTKLHIMDYSLLLGVHDCDQADLEMEERRARGLEEEDEDGEEYDSGGSGVGAALTPPDSPLARSHAAHSNAAAANAGGGGGSGNMPRQLSTASNGAARINPEEDIYAIPSRSQGGAGGTREIYFLALVDVLTHYGVKKQAAKYAKTVKYGAGVEGISTAEPESYSARFLEFVGKAIE